MWRRRFWAKVTVLMITTGKRTSPCEWNREDIEQVWFRKHRNGILKGHGEFGFPSFKIEHETSRDRKPVTL